MRICLLFCLLPVFSFQNQSPFLVYRARYLKTDKSVHCTSSCKVCHSNTLMPKTFLNVTCLEIGLLLLSSMVGVGMVVGEGQNILRLRFIMNIVIGPYLITKQVHALYVTHIYPTLEYFCKDLKSQPFVLKSCHFNSQQKYLGIG